MRRIEEIAPANYWPDDVLQLASDDHFYFVPFRIYIILQNQGRIQSSSIPYIHRMWFLPLILGYIFWKRFFGTVVGSTPSITGHVFCLSSDSQYRTEALFEIATDFRDRGEPTTILSVEGAKQEFLKQYDAKECNIVTFSDCFTAVSFLSVVRSLPSLWRIATRLAHSLEVDSIIHRVIAFNFLVVEFIKYTAIDNTSTDIKSFHTFAAMPYQTKAIDNDDIYAYQHGIEAGDGDRAMSIPKHAPISYFIWGKAWRDQFEKKAHPDSAVYSVGSPRFDRLVEKRGSESKDIDVLFLSGSQMMGNLGRSEADYRELVETVIDTCEEMDWNLHIKLHPIEQPTLYKKWGYDHFITEKTDINKLLLQADVAVTECSSAFVESAILGTPMVVTQTTMHFDFESFTSLDGLSFPDSLMEARDEIKSLKGRTISVADFEDDPLVYLGGSCDKIAQIISVE